MKRCSLIALALLLALTTLAQAEDTKVEAIAKDRQHIKGTWQIVSLEVNGNKSKDEDVRKLTVVNGDDGSWSLRSEGNEVAGGASEFDPTTSPKSIDFTTTSGGGKDQQYHGIYELGQNTRKLCFAPPGKARPTEFASHFGDGTILVEFERISE